MLKVREKVNMRQSWLECVTSLMYLIFLCEIFLCTFAFFCSLCACVCVCFCFSLCLFLFSFLYMILYADTFCSQSMVKFQIDYIWFNFLSQKCAERMRVLNKLSKLSSLSCLATCHVRNIALSQQKPGNHFYSLANTYWVQPNT